MRIVDVQPCVRPVVIEFNSDEIKILYDIANTFSFDMLNKAGLPEDIDVDETALDTFLYNLFKLLHEVA